MNENSLVRKRNRNLRILGILGGFTFMIVWLPLLRCMFDGTSYTWGQTYFGVFMHSSGLSFQYLALVLMAAFYVAWFISFHHLQNRRIFYLLSVGWWLHIFGNLYYELITEGDTVFHGDTLNVHVSLAAIMVPLSVAAIWLVVRTILLDRKVPSQAPFVWNRGWAFILLSPLPIQAVFFATGPAHNLTDQIAVIVAILQALLISNLFWPAGKKDRLFKPASTTS